MYVAGIDPGFNGGITIVRVDKFGVEPVMSVPMPIKTRVRHKKTEKFIDVVDLLVTLREYTIEREVFIEKVGGRPGEGITRVFTFGYNAGMIEGALTTEGFSLNFVHPQVWVNDVLKNRKTRDKPSRDYCAKTFPTFNWLATKRSRVPHDGLTDSCCIAIYGARQLAGWAGTIK